MTCNGCSNAVTRALSKLEGTSRNMANMGSNGSTGITTYEVSLEKQEVVVKGPVDYDTVLEKIKKTGKEASRNADFNTQHMLTRLQVRSGMVVA